jgi:hypothetical protein
MAPGAIRSKIATITVRVAVTIAVREERQLKVTR